MRITRWHGTNRAAALKAQALAAARTALGLPASAAYSVYVTGNPGSTSRRTSQAWARNGPDCCRRARPWPARVAAVEGLDGGRDCPEAGDRFDDAGQQGGVDLAGQVGGVGSPAGGEHHAVAGRGW